MLDLVKPEEENKIRLKDLKRCKLTNVFFDTFFNLEKYLENEQKDPFSNLKVEKFDLILKIIYSSYYFLF
jgi:serine/threonine-protein phosphatase 2A regulatory subunit B''